MRTVFLFVILLACTICKAQTKQKTCAVAFYNTENLFDTYDEPGKDDDDFTPAGAYHYTQDLYQQKLRNIAYVIQQLGASTRGLALIGLAEVENDKVLSGLINQPAIKGVYQYIWFDSPDLRGIDVALLYKSALFKPLHKEAIRLVLPDGEATRDILYVSGLLDKDTVYILVNHWPSRREGQQETAAKRAEAAASARGLIKKIQERNPHSRIILMGDLNDNPTDASVTQVLGAKGDKTLVNEHELFDPWTAIYRLGAGTLTYKKKWNLFDQVIISGSFLRQSKGWKFEKAEIFDKEFLTTRSGKQQGAPYRSWRGYHWMNGYSDHFPVVVYFSK